MTKEQKKDLGTRDHVLTIKITADERRELAQYAADRCVNVSALVRKLLFEQLRKECGV